MEPTKDSSSGAAGGFDALGLRPREQPAKTVVTDSGSQDGSDQSAPVYHHYHHHFHHTQPHGRVPSGNTENNTVIVILQVKEKECFSSPPASFWAAASLIFLFVIGKVGTRKNQQALITLNINNFTILCKRPFFPKNEALILNTESY